MNPEELSPETVREIEAIFEDSERKEAVVQGVCPHAQYCGSVQRDFYGNSTPEKFICRKNMLKHKRFDGLIMVEPFTDAELSAAFKRYCIWAYGETCETAWRFEDEFQQAAKRSE